MDLPYNWDFIQDNISSEKLAKLRRRFMEEWRSGNFRMDYLEYLSLKVRIRCI
jgi:hypothetical protein